MKKWHVILAVIILHPMAALEAISDEMSPPVDKNVLFSKSEKSEKKKATKAAEQTNKFRKRGVFDFQQRYDSRRAERHQHSETVTPSQDQSGK